ncbi:MULTISPECIES: GNAT family N-acetyltransferase [unclassified Tenacibaculum]|uniref:GNAT family N-acetyltransferase n=1 Tax=unclassified Tenacibaculum TaxID=2635139 RepID=UPI001F402156|nr:MULTISPECIES: GNAT family N-acetyltransferase [unclassified Tenacibaculum]MCF2875983.1 GNAT family N-acetyltransferase [Tenacibaculum sp. Cn5-1]MCF2936058.1 GNAT family N-acetyltransferase [Tenacibaculum sp. Cn5-34]MCG7512619.1 GNAT family N-acetyltransferase [Tenacibaculum sp. Cn5-46]
MKFQLETNRLILRKFEEKDTAHIFELDSNSEVHKYLGNNAKWYELKKNRLWMLKNV